MQRAIITSALALGLTALPGCGADQTVATKRTAAETKTPGAFVYSKELPSGAALYGMQADGTGERRIVEVEGEAVAPDFSPDGRRIVFEIDHGGPDYCSIAIVNAD